MITSTDIINKALVGVGAQKISSLIDGSNSADVAVLYYDDARQEILRSANWGFAKKTIDLIPYDVTVFYDEPTDGLPVDGEPGLIGTALWEVATSTEITPGRPWTRFNATLHYNSILKAIYLSVALDDTDFRYLAIGVIQEEDVVMELYDFGSPVAVAATKLSDLYVTDWTRIEIEVLIKGSAVTLKIGGFEVGTLDTSILPEFPPADGGKFSSLTPIGADPLVWDIGFYDATPTGKPAGTPDSFDYAFNVPLDLIKFQKASYRNMPIKRYGDAYLSNDSEVVLTYLSDITDVTKFPAHFIKALVAKLRTYFAVPLGGRNANRTNWDELYTLELERAISFEGTEESIDPVAYGINSNEDPWVKLMRR